MKKNTLFIFGLFVFLPLLTYASIDQNLKYGSQGTEVMELQDFLTSKGFLSAQTSGNFFSLTRNAVVAYQRSIGLPATGFVGPLTRTKINNELSLANASSIAGEISETGATTPPVQNSTTISAQQQIQNLLSQLAQLNTQMLKLNSNTQTQTQSQQTTQIAQNQTPEVISTSPVCIENLNFMVKKSREIFAANGFSGPVEGYTMEPVAKGICGTEWFIDYENDGGWQGGSSVPVTVTVKNAKNGNGIFFYSPVAGTHEVRFTAHNKDSSIKSKTIAVSFVSHGILTNTEITKIIEDAFKVRLYADGSCCAVPLFEEFR
jgi:peptidoglycan hydrolase-like protein with peptidoglycan-binding domain